MKLLRLCLLSLLLSSPGAWARWQPEPGLSWQIQFSGAPVDTSYPADVYVIDLFDSPQSLIDTLHAQGRKVICYFSAGTWENWRPDAGKFPARLLGKEMSDWPGERYLDISQIKTLQALMQARIDLAAQKRCDAVDPDNVDAYSHNNTGFALTAAQQLRYNRLLASMAHQRGLAIGLKNNLDQVAQLQPDFDFAVNESCHAYQECERLLPFIRQGKAVFQIEYKFTREEFCPASLKRRFSGLRKNRALDAYRESCH